MRHSKGKEFWETFTDDGYRRTPPPASFLPRGSSSGISDEMAMDSPVMSMRSTPPSSLIGSSLSNVHNPAPLFGQSSTEGVSSSSRSATPQPGPTAAEITRKVNNKRRRDDDFDPSSFKRRAVSPSMSVHNSPVMQSPMQREGSFWGKAPGGVPGKRVGFQGMVDTNDGLMKMSIE